MRKTEKSMLKTQAGKAPSWKPDLVEATNDKELSDSLAEFQVSSTLKIPSGLSGRHRDAMVKASVAHYREFAPADATERLLTTLSVGLQNAVMTSLQNAAHTDMLQARTEELKNATRAARVVTELVEALDKRRGRGKQSVGRVTVPGAPPERDPKQRLFEELEAIRLRLAANGFPVMEMSKAEILAILPNEVRMGILGRTKEQAEG
jgi:hypothetical protein